MWSFFEALVLVAMTIGQIWWVFSQLKSFGCHRPSMCWLSFLQVLEEILWSEKGCLKAPERMILLGTKRVFGLLWFTGLSHSNPKKNVRRKLAWTDTCVLGDLGDFIKKPTYQGYLCTLGSFIVAVATESFWSATMRWTLFIVFFQWPW